MKETVSWIIWTIFGYWFATKKIVPVFDQSVTETAPAAGPALTETLTPAVTPPEKSYDDRFHEGAIISEGLSELLNRRKVRRSMRRRKEDQRVL